MRTGGRRWQSGGASRQPRWRLALALVVFVLLGLWALGLVSVIQGLRQRGGGAKDSLKESEGQVEKEESNNNESEQDDDDDDERYVFNYWNRGRSIEDIDRVLAPPELYANRVNEVERFITFEEDSGGFNNIRMAFEAVVVAAKLLNRTLVMPPRVRFYLLDHGPIQLFRKPDKSYSNGFQDYFDFDVLRRGLRFITTEEFIERYGLLPALSPEERTSAMPVRDEDVAKNGVHTKWFMYLREHPDTVFWPSGFRSDSSSPSTLEFSLNPVDRIRTTQLSKRIIHFPVHLSKNLRYLEGAPGLVAKAPRAVADYSKEFLRRFLPYSTAIRGEARGGVKRLGGMLSYSCIHVRRNELQYKSSFLSAQASLANVRNVFLPGETIYIATDETEPGFFKAFTDEGFRVVKLKDAIPEPSIASKYDGMVEQLICAHARSFVGTSTSTFSSYINRLRLYIWGQRDERVERWIRSLKMKPTPDLRCWFHDYDRQLYAIKTGASSSAASSDGKPARRTHGCGDVGFNMFDSMFALMD